MNEELREEEGYEFIIVGDTEKYKECLIFTCGKKLDRAKEVLQECLDGADPHTKHACEGHTNLHIKRVKTANAWWHGNLD